MTNTGIHELIRVALVWAMVTGAVAAQVAPLEKSPLVSRIWLGMEEGVIRPAAFEQVRVEADGEVAVLVDDGAPVKKGQQWAIVDPVQLELERRGLALEEAKSKRQIEKEIEDLEDERIRMAIERQETVVKKEELLVAAGDPTLPKELRRRAGDAASKMQEKVDALDGKLTPESLAEERTLLQERVDLQLARQRKQFEGVDRSARILANCDGTLSLSDSIKSKLAERKNDEDLIWVRANEVIGVVRNDLRHELWIQADGPLLGDLPRDQLKVFVQDARVASLIGATYDRTHEVDTGTEIKRTYVFAIDEESNDQAAQVLGARCMVHVYRTFPQTYRLIYKKDIALLNPKLLESAGWAGLVRNLWPGSKVIQVGPQTIVVKPSE